jgi:TolB protein
VAVAAAGIAALLAVVAGGSRADAGARGLIVLQGKRGSTTALYVVGADGRGARRLPGRGSFSGEPSWSPKGPVIAFSSDRSGEGPLSIYRMNLDGSAVKRLTFDPDDDHDPAWSPDGRQIAYAGTGINLMFDDGSIVRRITAELPLRDPTWRPNGREIVFASGPNERLATVEIYGVRANGTRLRQLTNRRGGAAQPAWSPNGTQIAFVGGKSDLYVMNPDGTRQKRLTYTTAPESTPAWSPDGRSIVFARGTTRRSLYVIPAAGGKARLLLSMPGVSLDHPDWR